MRPETEKNLAGLQPWFFNDLKFIENKAVIGKIVAAIQKAVRLGEQKFDQEFGGWYPNSNQFGITTLRPHHLDNGPTASNNRWVKTWSSTTSLDWAAEESFINCTLDDDEIAVIYGYFNIDSAPNTIEMWIQPGNVKLPVIGIEPMQVKAEQYLIFPEPLVIEPRSPIAVKLSGRNISVEEQAGFLGYFIAPASTLLEKT